MSDELDITPGFSPAPFPESARQAIADAGYDPEYVIANDAEIDLATPIEDRPVAAAKFLPGLTKNEQKLFTDSARALIPVFREPPRPFVSSQTGTSEAGSVLGEATKEYRDKQAAKHAQPLSDLEVAQWGLELITEFNFQDIALAKMAHRIATDETITPKQKLAFHILQEMYDKKNITWDGIIRAGGNLALSPSSWLGLTTLGVGSAAAQAWKQAGKQGIKNYIKAYYPTALAVGIESGAYASLDDAAKQFVEIAAAEANPSAAESLELQDEFNLGQNLAMAGVGTALGTAIGGAAPAAISKAGDAFRSTVDAAMGGVLGAGVGPISERSLIDLLRGEAPDEGLSSAITEVRAQPTTRAANQTKRGTYQNFLTVDSPLENPPGGVVKKINPRNAERVLAALDANHARHPQPLQSPENFAAYFSDALGTNFSIIPPYQAIKYVNDPDYLRETMSRMSPEQIRLADEGFKTADQIQQLYSSKTAKIEDTAELFLWGMLSRMKSAFPHESAFLDAVTHADASGKTFQGFVNDFVAGRGNVDDFLRWAGGIYPTASPGRAASENMNAFAKTFLPKMTTPMEDGRIPLQVLHDAISDPNMTGREIRREFYKVAEGVGIDNKVLSFILLLTGRNDVMVFDRIQFNHLFNDGRFPRDFNIYQGVTLPKADAEGNPVMKGSGAPDLTLAPGSSIQEAGSSSQGLVLYEAVEDALGGILPDVYKQLGRPYRGMGQFHWESWVLASGQEVGHGTLNYFPAKMSGAPTPAAGARAIEGRYHKYQYGAQYGRNAAGDPVVDFQLPNGTTVEFTPDTFSEFAKRLNRPSEGVIDGNFNVSQFEDATEAWVNDPRVNQEAIVRIADDFVKSGRASVDANAGNAAGTRYSAGREAVRGFRRRIEIRSHTGDIGEASGPYEARVRRDDGGNELLTFKAKTGKAVAGLKSEVSLPAIKQVGADAAQQYFDDMTAAMSDHKFGAQVEIKSVDDLANLKLFRTEGGGGFALKPDSDIVAVFGNKSEPRSGYAVLSAAVQAGGKKLDAFDTFLPDIYAAAGFRIVGRMKFSDEFAPAPPEAIRAWDKQTFKKFNNGEPDIVFMVHDPDYFGPPTGGRYFENYEDAVAAQDAEVARLYPPKAEEE